MYEPLPPSIHRGSSLLAARRHAAQIADGSSVLQQQCEARKNNRTNHAVRPHIFATCFKVRARLEACQLLCCSIRAFLALALLFSTRSNLFCEQHGICALAHMCVDLLFTSHFVAEQNRIA